MTRELLIACALFLIFMVSSVGHSQCAVDDLIDSKLIVTLKNSSSYKSESQFFQSASLNANTLESFKAKGYKIDPLFERSKISSATFASLTEAEIEALPPTTFVIKDATPKDFDDLTRNPDVAKVEHSCRNHLFAMPNDPRAGEQWALNKIHASEAWNITRGSAQIIIAISDTGVDYMHPDLKDNMWINTKELNGTPGVDDDNNGCIDDIYGCDFAENDGDPMPTTRELEHGTHVAGIAGAVGDNNEGISGISQKVKIIAAKGFYPGGGGDEDALVKTIYYATNNGARVVNCSWGRGGSATQAMIDAVIYANSKGVMVVVAAGNSTLDAANFTPANVPGVVTVAATGSTDKIATFSNYGTRIDLAAPGGYGFNQDGSVIDGILSTLPRAFGNYGELIGTSMAAPYVTGLAALVLSSFPQLSISDLLKAMKDGGDSITVTTQGKTFNYKRINAFGALKAAQAITGVPPQGGPACDPTTNNNCASQSSNSGDSDAIPSNLKAALSGNGAGCGSVNLTNGGGPSHGGPPSGPLAISLLLFLPALLLFKMKKGIRIKSEFP